MIDLNQIQDKLDEDKILAVEELNLQARSNTSHALCSVIATYRLVDVVLLVENRQSSIPIPQHVKEDIIDQNIPSVRSTHALFQSCSYNLCM